MNKGLLVTRPCYDDATSYCFYYAGLLIKEAEGRGTRVYDLRRPRLNKKNFTDMITAKDPAFVFFNAHGSQKTISGDDGEILVEENKNHTVLDSRLVYARTCWSASSLGNACTGGCFIGYTAPFSFYVDQRWTAKPPNDNTARLFFEPSNLIVSSLLKGNTAEEAVSKSAGMTKKSILRLLREKGEPGTMVLIARLWNNMQSTAVVGNSGMRFA